MTKTKMGTTEVPRPRILRSAVALAVGLALSTALLPSTASARPSDKRRHLESSYALVVATVWGPGQRVVYGVKVQIRRVGEKKVLFEEFSNHSGEVAFRVPAGQQDYTLTADVKHSKDKTKPEVIAHVENDERVEVGLHLTE